MKRYAALTVVLACGALLLAAGKVAGRDAGTRVRFVPIEIYLDSGQVPLAAYQFELEATAGQVEIVGVENYGASDLIDVKIGVENGETPAFGEAPYYDPQALANDRIIIAAFSTGEALPTGRTRIATIHLQVAGPTEPEYELKLIVAADAEGNEIPAELTLETGEIQ